ncbi:MAG: hypothetical protein COX40_01235 [Candidatus Omnitrophica bacterium CG23_combo_of_CG06-09_8_20_14_all_40_11]|nr:MAG: hypothetical protein COX40_01235 [Candidatus Omnitrophica bacterium CG23_combo_of_CG06-09_8_20_14_all_40_11]
MRIAEKILKSNLPVRVKTHGSSMLPFIRRGDYLVIRPARFEGVKVGDIVAYSNIEQGNIICHRLIKKQDSTLISKGDSHIRCYERISQDSLLGKVIYIERGRNKISLETNFQRFLAHKIAWFSLNLSILLFLLGYLIEASIAPHYVVSKVIYKIRRYRILSS